MPLKIEPIKYPDYKPMELIDAVQKQDQLNILYNTQKANQLREQRELADSRAKQESEFEKERKKQAETERIYRGLQQVYDSTPDPLERSRRVAEFYEQNNMPEAANKVRDDVYKMEQAAAPKQEYIGTNLVRTFSDGRVQVVPQEALAEAAKTEAAQKKTADISNFEYSQGLSPEQREAFIKFRSQGGRIFTGNIGNGDQMFAQDSLGNISVLNIPVNQLKGIGASPAGATATTGTGTENTPGGVELPMAMGDIPIKAPLGKSGGDQEPTAEDYGYYDALTKANSLKNESERLTAFTNIVDRFPSRKSEVDQIVNMSPEAVNSFLTNKVPVTLRLGELAKSGNVREMHMAKIGQKTADQKAIDELISQTLRSNFPDKLAEGIKNTLGIQNPTDRTVAIMQLENDNPLYSKQIQDTFKNELTQQKGYETQLKINERKRKQEIKDPEILRDLNEKKLASAVKVLETAKPLSLEYWMAKLSEAEATQNNSLYKEAVRNVERLGTSGEASRYVTLKNRGGIPADSINNAIQDEKIMLETYKFLKTTPRHVWDDFTARAQSGQTWSTMLKNLEGVTDEKSRETWKFMTRLQQYINVYGNRMYGATLTNNERDNVMKVISGDSPLVGGNEIKASLSGLLDYYKGNLQIYDADLGTDFTNTEKMDKRIGIVAPPKGIIRKGALK